MINLISNSLVILIPIYQNSLNELEKFSIDYSLEKIKLDRKIFFIGPESLDFKFYEEEYPSVQIIKFQDEFFKSISGYNRLMLDFNFYIKFANYEFLLILQPDAILMNDNLDFWINRPFDYIGAPWPEGYSLLVNWDQFAGSNNKNIKVNVGNGGLSLRRVKSCILLFIEFPEAHSYFINSGSSEDLFFAFMGSVSNFFLIPNEIVASKFSRELNPSYYTKLGVDMPMGGHAWWKYDLDFWIPFFNSKEKMKISALAV